MDNNKKMLAKRTTEEKVRSLLRRNSSIIPKSPLKCLKLDVVSLRKNTIDELLRISRNVVGPFITEDYVSLITKLSFLDMIINTDIDKTEPIIRYYLTLF